MRKRHKLKETTFRVVVDIQYAIMSQRHVVCLGRRTDTEGVVGVDGQLVGTKHAHFIVIAFLDQHCVVFAVFISVA